MPFRAVRDLAGSPVADAGGQSIGAIYGALAEADTGLIRYFDLSLEEHPRHVLVPIGHARVHEPEGQPAVRLRAAVLGDLLEIPIYDPDTPLDADAEHDLLVAHGRCFYGERYYAHPAYDHTGMYAGVHEVVTRTADVGDGLASLRQLAGVRFAAGASDPRGWPLVGEVDTLLGTVDDLIVDTRSGQVRYLVVHRAGDGQAVLLPVGFILLEHPAHRAHAPGILAEDLSALPPYAGGGVDRPSEEAVRSALVRRLLPARRHVLPDFRDARRRPSAR